MPNFGTIQEIELTEIWPHEAADFTPWLAENLDSLGEILGLDLEFVESEAAVGDFSLDILARDLNSGGSVIIEDQLTRTDHDHLGKLLTYAAGHDAGTIVWISKTIRDEHRRALEWLNQRTEDEINFFGIVVEVIRIDDSKPAFILKPVVFPNNWARNTIQSAPKSMSGKDEAYRQFFQGLIDELRECHRFTSAKKAQPKSWCLYRTGIRGVQFATGFPKNNRAKVSLDFDFEDFDLTRRVFQLIIDARVEIENAYGDTLEFDVVENRRRCFLVSYFPGSIAESPERLKEIHNAMIERLLRMKKSVIPIVKRLVDAIYEEDSQPE